MAVGIKALHGANALKNSRRGGEYFCSWRRRAQVLNGRRAAFEDLLGMQAQRYLLASEIFP